MKDKNERIAYWGDAYLQSTRKIYQQAAFFQCKGDYFTAYLYLFVAFNNLYCLLARFEGKERPKIRAAIQRIGDDDIESIYTAEYVHYLIELNGRTPEQFREGPDADAAECGIVDMRDYFLGEEPGNCVAHLPKIAPEDASAEEKKRTIQDLAACLLYTVRNNQFHAIKGSDNLSDERVLWLAFNLLEPIVKALLPISAQEVEAAKHTVLFTQQG